MKPILNNVLVKPFPAQELSEGGIVIPLSVQEVNNKVRIVAVGNGTKKRPMYLKEGQTAHRVKNWGQEVMVGGELHFIMDAQAIIALE